MPGQLTYYLLAVLLLAQSAMLVHQSDFDAHLASSDDCVICHVAPALGGVASHVPVLELPRNAAPTPVRVRVQMVWLQSYLLPGNRSPPFSRTA